MSVVAPWPSAAVADRTTALCRRSGVLVRAPWVLPIAASAAGWAAYLSLRLAGGGDAHLRHVLMAGAMAVAMMGPLAVPVCVTVARATEWRHAGRGVAAAFATFALVWVAAGALLHVGAEAAASVAPGRAVAAALAGWAALDAASRRRATRLDACAVTGPIFPGARTSGVVGIAAVAGRRCVGTCWAPMALTVVDPRPAVVLAVSVAVVAERVVAPRPRLAVAATFVALAVVAAWVRP